MILIWIRRLKKPAFYWKENTVTGISTVIIFFIARSVVRFCFFLFFPGNHAFGQRFLTAQADIVNLLCLRAGRAVRFGSHTIFS